jgi:hypothetical protein
MKYLTLFLLISCGANTKNYIGKCYTPFIHSGAAIKVLSCTDDAFSFEIPYCVVLKENRFNYTLISRDTIPLNYIKESVEVNCSETNLQD